MGAGQIWLIIALIGAGTYLIRFSFLGLIGDRKLPAWVLRHLRYTPVAIIPGLVAPLVAWPEATGGSPDPARLAAAAVTLSVGYWSRSILLAITAGAVTLAFGLTLFG
ncbi:MAG: AzlD domain-containing protein [Alphaproteobacteria bacterium]|nr:AzlD domain-containing protein [Alphaproteobacteria bacterium]NNF23855.1 AzlD domain-containing protein [Paracoccaceae bacterium]